MKCPACQREYSRRDFDRAETYFECHDCAVALEMDEADEQRRKVEAVRQDLASREPRKTYPDSGPPEGSMLPAYLWVALLALMALANVYMAINGVLAGLAGIVIAIVAVFFVAFFAITITGVLRREIYGLYLTYVIFGFVLLSAVLSLFTIGNGPKPLIIGQFVGSFCWGTLIVLWLLWFVKNRQRFGSMVPNQTGDTHTDVYTARLDDLGATEHNPGPPADS